MRQPKQVTAALKKLAAARQRHLRELLIEIKAQQWQFAREHLRSIKATHEAEQILRNP